MPGILCLWSEQLTSYSSETAARLRRQQYLDIGDLPHRNRKDHIPLIR